MFTQCVYKPRLNFIFLPLLAERGVPERRGGAKHSPCHPRARNVYVPQTRGSHIQNHQLPNVIPAQAGILFLIIFFFLGKKETKTQGLYLTLSEFLKLHSLFFRGHYVSLLKNPCGTLITFLNSGSFDRGR